MTKKPAMSFEGAWEDLSPTELQIIDLVAEGLTNPQIGDLLHVSRRTVQSHLYNIFKKLGVVSRAQLAAQAASRLQKQKP